MAKKRYLEQPAKSVTLEAHVEPTVLIDKMLKEAPKIEKVAIEDMPLNSLSDYIRYNREARKLNHELAKKMVKKVATYEIKPCPVELHPTEKIVFNRKDQPSNPLHLMLSNDMIDFKMTLIPGKTYDLPRCVIAYLAKKGTPIWQWFDNADGSRETRIASMDPRFALRTIYED